MAEPRRELEWDWGDPRVLWGGTLAAFLLSFLGFAYLYQQIPMLNDYDSYFHLAVARLYGQQGNLHSLDWARFSAMHDGYGDKEFLFHLYLVPWVQWMDPHLGGKLALACLNAVVIASLVNLSVRAIGSWGLLIPFLTFGASASFALRMIRLRPELLSLILLIWIIWAAFQKRWARLGALVFVYTLSYTAVHAIWGLCMIWFTWEALYHRRWEWKIPVYATLGVMAGLLLHPQFPANLEIWKIQSIDYFRYKDSLVVGTEILPMTPKQMLLFNWGWLSSLFVFWVASRFGEKTERGRPSDVFWISACVFGVLFVLMSRFSIYAIPLVTLALFWGLCSRGRVIGPHIDVGKKLRIPTVAALLICMLSSFSVGYYMMVNMINRKIYHPNRESDLVEFAGKIPENAKVAASWAAADLYVFWAPQAQYLNVLDPVFMTVASPETHRIKEAFFAAESRDMGLALKEGLDSDYFAFPKSVGTEYMSYMLAFDPRFENVHAGWDLLYRIHPDRNRAFTLDWKIVSESEGKTRVYPRHEDEVLRRFEGYVDLNRIAEDGDCVRLVHDFELSHPAQRLYEFAPRGKSTLTIDGEPKLRFDEAPRAPLGRGAPAEVDLAAGTHRIEVTTCRDGEEHGFYLIDRLQPL